nr:hypothetical protein [Tanacetum cinerariifolium]
MLANQEHVHLVWPLWSDLRVIPTHGEFRSLVRPVLIFARSCLVDLNRVCVPIPAMPVPHAGQVLPSDVLNTHTAWVKASKEITGLMLMTIDPDIQKNLEQLGAYDMLKELETLYTQQAEQELLQTVREFHACKQEEGQSVSSYVFKMKSYIDNLERLDHAMTQNLVVSLILVSLRKEYDSFVQTYNMHGMGKTVTELHFMLKLHEQTLPQKDVAPALHAIRSGRIQEIQKKKPHKAAKENQGKGKAKMGYVHVPAPANYPVYLAELLKKKSYLKELALQGLRESKKLKPGALSLYVGEGHRATVEAIGEFHLCLPSGLVLILHNYHYAPSITRGIILALRLYDDGFVNRFDGNVLSIFRNNLVYFIAIPKDGIYEIDLSSSNSNDSSMYAISNKRAKLNLDSTLLWHCRLGHISKKRIKKLQHDGLLDSTDIKSFKKCVSCMSGKMARKPYSHQVEKAKDLLRLIHTDVYGPFRTVSRQGASYFSFLLTTLVKTNSGRPLSHYVSDREGEYMSQEFLDHLKKHGIIAHRTPPYTPQHNGVSKRRNRTLLDMVRSMMSQTTLPKSFWDYALEFAARILNMVLTKKVDKTPYEEMMGYSFDCLPENKVFVARNAEFFKNSRITQEATGSLEDLEIIQEEDTHPSIDTSLNHEEDGQEIDEPQSDINSIRKSSRARRAPDRMCLHIDAEEHELGDLSEPTNYKAALLDPESDKWLDALNVEMQSMKDNEKTDMDGAIHTYKARLVAKGFTQTYVVDYEETFSSVADIRAIRILIAIAAFYDYEIWKMNVKTAFLDGHLFEEVYMVQPEGFVNPKFPNRLCKLKRSIYGFKQTSRQWNKRFDDEIKKFDFSQNCDEPCVYMKASGSYVTFLILYVDEILIMGNNIPMLQDVKSYLRRCFTMKDLGEAAYILGIKIYRDRSKRLIGLCQSAYTEKILKRYFMENSKRGTIPMQEKLKWCKSQGASTPAEKQRMQNVSYASAVGSIMYDVRCDTIRKLRVSCYTDVGYLTDADDLKSQTRYVFVLNGGAVDWKSTKQIIFATSSMDVEYIAAFDASK